MRTLLFFSLIFLGSCQISRNSTSDVSIVDFNQTRNAPSVTAANSNENTYGPVSFNEDQEIVEKQKNPIVAIDLSPGLYNSLAYIELFDQLDRNSIEPNILVASGFSAVIAGLYAKYNNANRVNFKAFSLLAKLKKERAHSRSWYSELDDFLKEEFGEVKQESFKTLLVIPYYNKNKLVIKYSGILRKNLMRSIDLNKRASNFLIRPNSSYTRLVQKLGVDLMFKYTVFDSSEKIKTDSGFLLGIYSKIKGFTSFEAHDYKSLKVKSSSIDKIGNISDLLSGVRSRVNELVESMKLKIKIWKENKR